MEKSYLVNANTVLEKDYFCVIPKNGSTEVGWYQNSVISQNPPPEIPLDMEYSFNKTTWYKYTKGTDITTTAPIYFRGNNTSFVSGGSFSMGFIYLKVDNTVDLAGRINSLSKKWSYDGAATEMPPIYHGVSTGIPTLMFNKNPYIRSIADLRLNWNITDTDTTNIQLKTYQYMFYGCENLIDTPKFQCTATAYVQDYSHALFGSMFSGCTSLTTVSDLSNITITPYCFQAMFNGCTALTTISHDLLPATTLAEGCYQLMFNGCKALTKAVVLPATILAEKCYDRMFYNCRALTEVPALYATVLPTDCYKQMFTMANGGGDIPYVYFDLFSAASQPTFNDYQLPYSGTITDSYSSSIKMFGYADAYGYISINTQYKIGKYVNGSYSSVSIIGQI